MTAARSCPTCGYTGTYPTEALAQARFPRHSCKRQLARAAIEARQAHREAGRARRDCQHSRARHTHGTRAAYVSDRCRCADCAAANAAYMVNRYKANAYGRWAPYVDAAPARDHLLALTGNGLSINQIAATTGISARRFKDITRGRAYNKPASKQVRADTARAILAMPPDAEPWKPGIRVDALGTRRRVRALTAIGFTPKMIAAYTNSQVGSVERWLQAGTVTHATATKVRLVYARLHLEAPPQRTTRERRESGEARTRARANGWLPPLVWDNVDTDSDPGPAPEYCLAPEDDVDSVAIERAVDGDTTVTLNRTEIGLAIDILTATGHSLRDIAARLRISDRTVTRRRATHSGRRSAA